MIDMNVATDVSIAIYDVEKGSCVIRILYHSGKDVNNIDLDVRLVVLKRRDFWDRYTYTMCCQDETCVFLGKYSKLGDGSVGFAVLDLALKTV